MMKGKNIKAILLLALSLCVGVPTLKAQRSDGFFSSNSREDLREDNFGVTATTETFQDTPIGGGLAILVASAAGYTLLKRRKSSNLKTHNNLKHTNS